MQLKYYHFYLVNTFRSHLTPILFSVHLQLCKCNRTSLDDKHNFQIGTFDGLSYELQILRIKQLTQGGAAIIFSVLFNFIYFRLFFCFFFCFLACWQRQKENVTAMPKRNGRLSCSVDFAKCRLSAVCSLSCLSLLG